ncbi:hypothetical protein SE91_20500 [Bradyrhizobium sp. DOA1]|nr:hypothetical protein SE91_20500 [Bradyrhizobium sp. DOA1]
MVGTALSAFAHPTRPWAYEDSIPVIARAAKQSESIRGTSWIASSQELLAMTDEPAQQKRRPGLGGVSFQKA